MKLSSKKMVGNMVKVMAGTMICGLFVLPATGFSEEAPAQQAAPVAEAPAAAPVQAAAPAAQSGDANLGRALFTGETRFSNGGPACISCHSASIGALDGGKLAPNLTNIAAGEKSAFLDIAWVNGGGSPVMGPIFGAKNVTEEEMNNLRAFFNEQAKQSPQSKTGAFLGIGIGGFVALLILFSLFWSGRYRNRNQGTAHDALWRNYGGKGGR